MIYFGNKNRLFLVTAVSYLYIILFIYAATGKLLAFEEFQIQLGQSPLLSAYAGTIAIAVPVVEILIALLLMIKATRIFGLYASTFLMSMFTAYIFIILNYSDYVPCSCGGVLEEMGWTEHLIFNSSFLVFAIAAIWFYPKDLDQLKPGIL